LEIKKTKQDAKGIELYWRKKCFIYFHCSVDFAINLFGVQFLGTRTIICKYLQELLFLVHHGQGISATMHHWSTFHESVAVIG